jgi:hypothetical protein
MDRGITACPGLKIETLRRAQGRLWGTRIRFFLAVLSAGVLSLPLNTQCHAQQAFDPVERQLARVEQAPAGPFKPDWDSLGAYRVPEWFRDAKFGIFIHWGVFSVPAFDNEWYPRNMYIEGSKAFKHHVETYGPQARFGYKDFIPMFRAENFDADAWVDLFARAGARYWGTQFCFFWSACL